jgi:hypothetical protein
VSAQAALVCQASPHLTSAVGRLPSPRFGVNGQARPLARLLQRKVPTKLTGTQQDILTRLGIDPAPKIYQLTPAVSR